MSAKKKTTTTRGKTASEEDLEGLSRSKAKLVTFLKDPDIQREMDGVLKAHFPRFDAKKNLPQEQVLMQLLHRDAADSFIDRLYEAAKLPKPKKVMMPKQLIR